MEQAIARMLEGLSEHSNMKELADTPKRAAKAYRYLTQGYEQNLDEIINGALYESNLDEMVLVQNIELYSLCEHHLLPFLANATSPIFHGVKYLVCQNLLALPICTHVACKSKNA